ncbi:DUF1059 domain-containing protein [Nitrosopumilus piranensis]|uniref:DUF1059 domain-containing protein n=1 Tax=Nitrosopumilus piranensis TaxID=1582439 RepID=A0A0C5BXQ3_9ARCH|nr:DUF1059 domain-containing protein [Nitrosopumilus piranensis]AJM93076.1 hypothetical protein NPIRD3C_1866 [Nitrosopumilus piranensis]
MFELKCNDYGFECNYEIKGDKESVTEQFKAHVYEEHGIDYTKEAVTQFIRRKYPECK